MKNLLFFLLFILFKLGFSQEDSISFSNDESEGLKITEVERVPIYPGCQKKKDNSSLAKCMAQKINNHISKNLNTKSFNNVGNGKYKIMVFYKIDMEGKITDVKVMAPYPEMEKEAKRVIGLIPNMLKPGYQKEKPVVISYFLPINFVME